MAEPKRPRISIDLDVALQRRIRVAAARRGESISAFCLDAVQERLKQEEDGTSERDLERVREAIERAREFQERVFGDRVLEISSAELIREAREERTAQLP